MEFRALSTDHEKTLLFLSWIGKHDSVTGSTIARWLKTCLTEAGIDTGIFKAHSIRGASSSKAAVSGITTADILQAADWSSESTFQKFYHHPGLTHCRSRRKNLPLGGSLIIGCGIKLTCLYGNRAFRNVISEWLRARSACMLLGIT